MAIYQAVCLKCGGYYEYYQHFSKSHETPECCGQKTEKRILSAPMARFDIQPWDAYISPSTGKTITSYAQRREDMKASGCRDFEGIESEKRSAERSRQYDEEELDKKLDARVRTAWAELSPAKKALALKGT